MIKAPQKILSFLSSNSPHILTTIFIFFLIWYAYGCTPKTKSLIDDTKKVDLQELNLEFDTLLAKHKIRIEDLQKQQELKNFIFNQAFTISQEGEINPLGILTSLIALLGIGSTIDDIKQRKTVKKLSTYQIKNLDDGSAEKEISVH